VTTFGQVPVGTRPGTRTREPCAGQVVSAWLLGLRVYLGVILVGNLIWETLHLPLYTIWTTGTPWERAFAVVHCTFGDLLIAASTLTLALILAGDHRWPRRRFWLVASLTIVFGIGYTAFSEWLNVVARASWTYSDWMPIVPVFGLRLGLSPLLQWLIVPTAAFKITQDMAARYGGPS
jgi:hypothetical protein